MRPIGEAIRYPIESDDWQLTVLIGGVLTLFSFLLIPGLLVGGYVVRVVRGSAGGSNEPPVFDDWGRLLVDGVQAWIIGFVYMLVPTIVAAVTIGGSLASMATGSTGGAMAGIAGFFGGFILWFVLTLLFGYLAVAGIVNFAREERFGAAFDFGTIREVVTTSEYAVAWLVAVAVMVVAGIVVGVLNVIPFLGFIVGSFVSFYAVVVAATLWTDGFTDAIGYSAGEEPNVVPT